MPPPPFHVRPLPVSNIPASCAIPFFFSPNEKAKRKKQGKAKKKTQNENKVNVVYEHDISSMVTNFLIVSR